jgi:ATP-dependent exoDNAse (exonuclease V) beta subunit
VAESDLRVATDNPLTGALLALLRAAAYPGDTLAREHVRMTPLEGLLAEDGMTSRDGLTLRILAEVQAKGFAGMLERWLRRLAPQLAGDDFSRERGRLLVAAAERFDENGSRDVAEFLEFAEAHRVRDADAAGVVRVMTVHKAKGLGFDLVILPDLEGKKLALRRDGLALQRAQDRSVEWVLDLPAKLLAEHDPVLAAHVATAESDAAYENLCLLYVALTRAKRAMYLVTEPPAAKSTSQNFTRLLRDTLGETWSDGDPRWYKAIESEGKAAGPDGAGAEVGADGAAIGWVRRAARRPARTPSALKKGGVSGSLVFALKRNEGADFGTAVHARFAEIEWIVPGDVERLTAAWTQVGSRDAASDETLACLRAEALAACWTRPTAAQVGVWRERSFEMVLDGAWVTGIFDRVVVERDESGRAVRATILDFKTDRVSGTSELAAAVMRHSGQLNLYRRVVVVLAGLAPAKVECVLIFTRLRKAVTVPIKVE